jgi:hypothetical protein
MKKPVMKRLVLGKETLRDLENEQLDQVAGGTRTRTCTSVCSFCTL